MEKSSCTDYVKNYELLKRVEEERNILRTVKWRKLPGLVTSCIGTSLKKILLEERYL